MKSFYWVGAVIKFTTWNLENFFLTPHIKYPHRILKSQSKVLQIAEVIKKISPDFLFLTEVGGKDDLNHLNRKYLNDSYEIFFKKGNSNRGIELGFMAKRSFLSSHALEVVINSHAKSPISFHYPHEIKENKEAMIRGHKIPHKGHRMSRDLLQVEVYKREDRTRPLFILLGVHFKSKLDKEGIDWNGRRRRHAECRFSAQIYQKLSKKYHGKVPIFLTGDFNGEAHSSRPDPEFRDLSTLDIEDFSEALDLPDNHRYTFIGMDKNKKPLGMQLDYFFMPKEFDRFLIREESGFYRYSNEAGEVYPIPQNPGAKHALPSDHYPIVITFGPQAFEPMPI